MTRSAVRAFAAIATWACAILGASDLLARQERRPVVPPDQVTVEHVLKVIDKDGKPVVLPDGVAHFRTSWDSKPKTELDVPLQRGRCSLTAARNLKFILDGIDAGDLAVVFRTPESRPLGELKGPVEVEGMLLEPVELHVVADESGEELVGVEIEPCPVAGLLAPKESDVAELRRTVRDADGRSEKPLRSPLKFTPTRSFGGYAFRTRIIVRCPSRVGIALEIDFAKGGRRELRLQRPVRLSVRALGFVETPVAVPDGMERRVAEWLQRPQPHLRPTDLSGMKDGATMRELQRALAEIEAATNGALPDGIPPELEANYRAIALRVAARGFAANTMSSIEGSFDASGAASFDELEPGRYLLTIETKGLRPATWDGSPERYVWKMLPGRIEAAALVTVERGKENRIELPLPAPAKAPEPGSLTISVRDVATGELLPAAGLRVVARPLRILETTQFDRDLPPLAQEVAESGRRIVVRGDVGFAALVVEPTTAPWFVPCGRVAPLRAAAPEIELPVERATGLRIRWIDEGAVVDAGEGLSPPQSDLFRVVMEQGDRRESCRFYLPDATVFVVPQPGVWRIAFPKGDLFGERPPLEVDLPRGSVIEREIVVRPPPPAPKRDG